VNDNGNENLQQEHAHINDGMYDLHHQRLMEEAAEATEDRVHEFQWMHAVEISEQMTRVSVSNYVPGITQINCVMTIAAALTEGGKNITPCDRYGNFPSLFLDHGKNRTKHKRTENEWSSCNMEKCECETLPLWLLC